MSTNDEPCAICRVNHHEFGVLPCKALATCSCAESGLSVAWCNRDMANVLGLPTRGVGPWCSRCGRARKRVKA